MRCAIFFLMLLINLSVYGQGFDYIDSYFKLTSKAKCWMYKKEYDSSIILFENAFKEAPYTYAYDDVMYAKCLYEKNRWDEGYQALIEGIENGFRIFFIDSLEFEIFFNDSLKHNGIINADKKYQSKLKSDLQSLYDSSMYYMYNEKFYNSWDEDRSFLQSKQAQRYIDSSLKNHQAIEHRLLSYILKNGWIGDRRLGMNGALLTAAAHMSEDQLEVIVPFLFMQLREGYITPDEYAFIDEKLNMAKSNGGNYKCLYNVMGYQCSTIDWNYIISNRSRIGMSIYLDGDDYIFGSWNKRGLLIP